MRYIFTVLFFCLVMLTNAQPSFQGKIEYDVRMSGETLPAKFILSFGVNKIKMEFMVPGKTSDNDYVIINLDSGKVFTMNMSDKSYETKGLYKKLQWPTPALKEIAGFHTTPIVIQEKGVQPENDFLAYLNNGVFYTADDLYYAIPEMYVGNPELLMVKNGKIVLGADIIDLKKQWNTDKQWNLNKTVGWGNYDDFFATALATAIMPMNMDSALFVIPAGYTEKGLIQMVDVELSPVKESSEKNNPAIKKTPKTQSSKPVQKKMRPEKESSIHRKKD